MALLAAAAAADAGGFKILGGFMKEFNMVGTNYYGNTYKWGQTKTDADSKELQIESMYCWSTLANYHGFCEHIIIVSTKDDPNEQHYQLVGSNQRIYEYGVLMNSEFEYGIISKTPPIVEYHVANGWCWCEKRWDFRYGELYFYFNKTSQPSASDDYSTLNYLQGYPGEHKDEVFVETHYDTSVRIHYSSFSRWSEPWGSKGYTDNFMWMAPATLKEAIPLSDQAQSKGVTYNPRKQVLMRNEGSGLTSPDMPVLGATEEVSYSNEGRFMTSFDFEYSIEEEVSFNILPLIHHLG